MTSAFIHRAIARNLRWQVKITVLPSRWAEKSSVFSTSAPAISSVPHKEQESKNGSTWSNLLLFIPGAITFGLGTWQIFRRQKKIEMIDHRQSRLGMEPLKGNQILPLIGNFDTLEFRRLQCRGAYDHSKSIFLGPRSRSISGVTENGYYLITPLFPVLGDPESAQSPILVNRGWVPRSWRDKALNATGDHKLQINLTTPLQEGDKSSWWHFWPKKRKTIEEDLRAVIAVEVLGVIRDSENPSIFVPANDPGTSQWFYVDVPAIACACGLSENTLYIEDINENINPSNPYPVPKDPNTLVRNSVMPQDHLNYTLTWYSLSAAVTYMAINRLKPRKSRR